MEKKIAILKRMVSMVLFGMLVLSLPSCKSVPVDGTTTSGTEISSVVDSVTNSATTVKKPIETNSVSNVITGATKASGVAVSETDTPTTLPSDTTRKTTGTTTVVTQTMPPWRYSPRHVPTVEALIDFVKPTVTNVYDGQYISFLTRARSAGVCVPRYRGKYLEEEERGIALMFETEGEAPGLFYYFPEGIVCCYYIEDGLADEAKKQLAFFRHGKEVRGTVKEALEEALSKRDIKTENLISSDNRKLVCALSPSDDRKKATFLLNENILITVDVFNRYQLSPKEVIRDLEFELVTFQY